MSFSCAVGRGGHSNVFGSADFICENFSTGIILLKCIKIDNILDTAWLKTFVWPQDLCKF